MNKTFDEWRRAIPNKSFDRMDAPFKTEADILADWTEDRKLLRAEGMKWSGIAGKLQAEVERLKKQGMDMAFDEAYKHGFVPLARVTELEAGLTQIYDTVAKVSVDTHHPEPGGESYIALIEDEKNTDSGARSEL